MSSYHYQTADPLLYSLLKEFAEKNRNNPTMEESLLWEYLQGNLTGWHFRRQHIIGEYIADFVCLACKLIIEVDGGYHQLPEQQVSDEYRTTWLEKQGFKVIRFTNEEITGNIDSVLDKIQYYLNSNNNGNK